MNVTRVMIKLIKESEEKKAVNNVRYKHKK